MSKFLPMFKKKGKGKEEDGIEDSKKKRSKAHKLTKEILSSPPSSVILKAEKKKKSSKRKAPNPQGKENYPTVEELERELLIDGVVGECPSELYIDSVGTIREGSRELFIDNALAPEDSNPESISDTSHEDCSLVRESHENSSPRSDKDKDKDTQESLMKHDDDSDSNLDSSFESPRNKEHESSPENQNSVKIVASDDSDREQSVSVERFEDEGVILRKSTSQISENESGLNPKLASRLRMSVEFQYWREEEAAILECELVEDSTEEIQNEPEVNDKISEEKVHEVVDDSDSINSPIVSTPEITDDYVTVKTGGNTEAETEVEEKVHDDSLVETICSNSDDDFDSAKEDWDDEDSEEKEPKHNGINSQVIDDFELSKGIEELTEAENLEMKDKYEDQCSRHTSTTSSLYQDATSKENSLYDINSIVEAANESQSVEESSTPSDHSKELTRKVSNISVASSDIFNEELDDLLDEELDRLSEEETSNNLVDSCVEIDKKPSEISVGELPQDQVLTEEGLVDVSYAENCETPTPEQESSVITPEKESKNGNERQHELTDDAVVVNESDAYSTLQDNKNPEHRIEAVTGTSGSDFCAVSKEDDRSERNVAEKSVTGVNELDARTAPKGDESSEHNVAEESVTSQTTQALEVGLDQAKDSGYYSLPVSPKPNTVAVSEREQAVGAPPSSPSVAQEECLAAPVTEMTISTSSVLETSEVQKPSLENTVSDQTDASVSAEFSQSCAVPKESEEGPSVTKVNGCSALVEDKSQENSEMSQKVEGRKRPTFDKFKSPPPDAKGTAQSPGVSGRQARLKSPGVGCEGSRHSDDNLLSSDPVGDLFLQQAVCMSHNEAEARLAQRRAARAEARELRLRELERQQHEQENEEEKQFASPSYTEPVPRAGHGRAAGRASGMNCSGQYSRRSSEDSTTDEAALPANVREMRSELKELDEKFRKAMITNAQLDNEKATLTFEVELFKDRYTELEETHTQLTKENRKKCTEYEQLRKVSTKLQEEVKILRSLLQERDQLIQEYGLVVIGEEENGEEVIDHTDDDVDDLSPRKLSVKKVLVSQEAADLLSKGAAKGSLDVRLKKFGEEKNDLEDKVRRLKLELEEERNKNRRKENGLDYEKQKEQSKTVNEYKFRIQKLEAEVSTLQANKARSDALLTRYRTQLEELETSEEELKLEKRKLLRELRDAQSRLEELETTNNHLIKRFDKLKNARSNLLKDLSQDPA